MNFDAILNGANSNPRTVEQMEAWLQANAGVFFMPNFPRSAKQLKRRKEAMEGICQQLSDDETVLFVFDTVHGIYDGPQIALGAPSVVFTDRRMIACEAVFLGLQWKIVDMDTVKDSRIDAGFLSTTVRFDTLTDKTGLSVTKDNASQVLMVIQEVVKRCKARANAQAAAPVAAATVSAADEILKFKSLLDAGILTQEEFDAKKKQLLGL